MPARRNRELPFPVRGTTGGYRDPWDAPDDCGALRSQAESAEARLERRVAATAKRLRAEQQRERRARKLEQRCAG